MSSEEEDPIQSLLKALGFNHQQKADPPPPSTKVAEGSFTTQVGWDFDKEQPIMLISDYGDLEEAFGYGAGDRLQAIFNEAVERGDWRKVKPDQFVAQCVKTLCQEFITTQALKEQML